MADYSNVPFGDEKPAQVSPDTSIPELATPTRKKSIYDDIPLPPQPEVSTVLQNAQTVKPDEAARAQQLGVPDRVYAEDKQKIEDRAFVEEKSQMLQDFPATSFWLTKNPDNAKLVSDDLNATVKFEEAVKTFVTPEELGTVANTLATMWEKSQNVDVARNITAGAYKGLGSIIQGSGEMLNVYSRSVSGAIDGVLDSLGLTAVKEAINTPVPSFLIPGEVLRQAGETINTVGKAVSDSIPADRQNFQDTVGEGVGQAAAQMTAIIMTGGGAAGPITFKTVGEMVMGARAAFMMLAQGATQAAEDTKKFGVYGTPEGDSAIMLGAGATAVAERFSNNLIFSKIPQYFSGLASRVMAGATTEAVSEAYEQVLNNLAAIALYDPSRSVADQVAENAKAGGAVGAVLSGLLPGASLVTKDFKNATVAEKRAADMDAILKSLEQSKLAARSPAAFDDMLATVTSELNMGDVFIPVSALDKVTGDVADIIYPSLGLTDEQVQAARARGGDVKVSAANFVREMNLDPTRYEAIRNEMRFAEDAPSLNDVAAIQDVAAAEQADEAVRNAQNVNPNEFSGEVDLLHGSSVEMTEFVPSDKVDPETRYDSGGGVFGNFTYLDPTGRWVSGDNGALGIRETYGVKAKFDRLFILRPDNVAALEAIVGREALSSGKAISEALIAKGYDGISVQGFDKLADERHAQNEAAIAADENARRTFVEDEIADATGLTFDVMQDQVVAFKPEKSLKITGKVAGVSDDPALYDNLRDPTIEVTPEMKAARAEAYARRKAKTDAFAATIKTFEGNVPNAEPAPTPESQAAIEAVDIATRELGLQAMILDTSIMSAAENAEYVIKVAKARRAAEVRQEAKVLRAQQKVLSAEYASEKATIRPVIEATVKLRPEYKAMDDIGQDQLDHEAVVDLWGAQAEGMAALPKHLSPTGGSRSIVSKPGKPGLAPEVVADRAGFPNVRAMMDALSTMTPFEQAVEEATEAAMKERYPDLFDRQTAIDSARQELLSDDTAEVLAAEFDAIRAARKEGRTSAKLIRAAAKAGLADMKVGDISVNAFINTMIRKGQRAGMYLRGTARDPNTQQNLPPSRDMAAQAKFEQLMNLEYARAATGVVQKTEAAARHMAKLADPSGKFPGIDAEYMDQIRERLAGFDFSDSKTKGSSDTHYTDLSLKDFHQIHAEVVFLEKQGRLQQTLFDRKQERDLNTTVERLLETVAEPRPPEPTLGDPFGMKMMALAEEQAKREAVTLNDGAWKKFKNKVLGWGAYTAKVELEMKRLDGGQIGGPWQRAVFQPLAKAEALELDMDKKAMKSLLDAITAINKEARKAFGRPEYDPLLGVSLTMADRVMIALNSGNDGNLQTMIEGSQSDDRVTIPWTREAIEASNARLSPEMADLVQKVWNGFAKLQPEVEAIYRRHVGNNFKAIKPTKVMVGGKELTGGYYPLVYDEARSGDWAKQSTLEKMKDPMYRAMVFSGMTEERTGYSAPLSLDLSNLPHAMRQQIHYITHFDAVDNVNKLLQDKRIRTAVKDNLGEPYYRMLDDWLSAVASNNADHSGSREINQTISALRSNITVATLGLSATTLAAQTFGTASSVKVLGEQANGKFSTREGAKWLAIGFDQYLADPASTVQFIKEASGEMRHRIGNAERDMMQVLARIQDRAGLYVDIQRASLMAIGGMQFYTVDVPTWVGGLNKAIAMGLEGSDAVAYADATVRLSQASGKVKDLSAIQRGKGFGQAITMFSTWTMLQFEQGVQSGRKLAKDPASATAEMLWMFAIPAVAAALMRQQVPEEDDEALAWWGAKIALDGARSVPVLGAGVPAAQLGARFMRGLVGAYKDLEKEELPSPKHLTDVLGPIATLGGVPGTAQMTRFVSIFEAEQKGFDWNVFDAVTGFRTPKQRAKLIFN